MRGAGITVSPKFIYIAVAQKSKTGIEIIDVEQLRIPGILSTPDKLHFIRTYILDLLHIHQVDAIGIRIADRQAPNISMERIEIEGTVQELTTDINLKKVCIAPLRELGEELNINEHLNDYISGKKDFFEIKHWYITNNSDAREAVIAVAAALNERQ
jgi:hypothetical protein